MAEIRANQVVSILQSSGVVPKEVLEKISNLLITDPNISLLDSLLTANILNKECTNKIRDVLEALESHFHRHTESRRLVLQKLDKISTITLSDEMKKDILFARQVIAEGLCKIEDVNRCFDEQATMKRSIGKTLLVGQIMVKNHFIAVDRFVQIHRDIEQQLKNTDWTKIFMNEKRVRLTLQGGIIQFIEGNIPQKFGAYQILEEVARGAMGVVYKAWDDKLKRTVALKVLKDWENPPQDEIRRFHREARLAASLHHPNIVSIYDSGIVEGVHYYTMDFVEGQTLSQYLKGEHRNFQEELSIIRELALALHYAHSHGVIHRDVKPDNIILDENKHPLLTDFGLAKGINTFDSHRLTQTGEALGTPAYMSPEQAKGSQIDGRSDIYSLGTVLYEILVGRPPFQGEAVMPVISAVLSKDPVSPSKLNPKIHRDIETICLKAMARNMADRYATGKEMAEDIDRFLYGQAIKAKPVSFWGRLGPKLAQHLGIVVPMLVLWAILLAWLGWIGLRSFQNYRNAEQNYETGLSAIQEKKIEVAWNLIQAAGQHPSVYQKVQNKLAELAAENIQKGNQALGQYRKQQQELEPYYVKEINRLRLALTAADKQDALYAIQNCIFLQRQNEQQLQNAYHYFGSALLWQPMLVSAWHGILQVQQEYLGKYNLQFHSHIYSNLPWQPDKLETLGRPDLQIESEPAGAKVYIFAFQELYWRQIPIPYKVATEWSKQAWANRQSQTQAYFEVAEPQIVEESYAGQTPLTLTLDAEGQYLIVLQKEECYETRQICQIYLGKQQIKTTLPSINPLLPLPWRHFTSPHSESGYSHFMSEEITCAQYQEFLNDPKTIAKYKKSETSGQIIYAPRIQSKMLWKWDGNKFQPKEALTNPVVGISWYDAQNYCEWLTQKSNGKILYRLPYIKEWQWAAGKAAQQVYPWGNMFDLWFLGIFDGQKISFDVSPFGISKMVSGVAEWCWNPGSEGNDWHKLKQPITWPISIVAGTSSRLATMETAKIDAVRYQPPNETDLSIGFRVVAMTPNPK